MKKYFLICISSFLSMHLPAQNNGPWRGKKAAVVITYDDAISQHLDNAIPVLDSLGLKATFYITANTPATRERLHDWKRISINGHELGNHTLFHPCIGGKNREWVSKEYDMSTYTIKRMTDEIRMTNTFLETLDGKKRRTFAFTCGDMKVQDSFFINGMKNEFVAARAVRNEMHRIEQIDLYNVDCYMVNNHTAEQMIGWVNKAIETNSLLVILFHGVGGGNSLDVSLAAHRQFLHYLKQNEKDLWVAPMVDVADFIKDWQNRQAINKLTEQANDDKGLKDHYKKYFTIGVAVSPQALKTDEAALIIKHFGSMTPENAMKIGPVHPKENEYNWAGGDSIAAFAKRNNMKLRGHTLCWHNQTPGWFFKDAEGKQVRKEVLLQRMKDHITTVVSRYKGTIYAWDVVNEAISDKADEYYRPSLFYQICGEEFIAKAFEYAHAADPDALLFYNDYNEINEVKREKIIRMIKGLQAKGVPIHGIGLQGHWAVNEPSQEQLDKTLDDFSKLRLQMQITELDISVYPKEHDARERKPSDYDTTFSAEKEQKQMEVYRMCFELFRKYKKYISAVTFWNISDRHSWLDDFPVRGRKDYPLLFDKELQPKKAYWEVVKF